MRPESRAIVFDLDDTLYPYRHFVRSGFLAVASYLELTHGVNRAWATHWMIRASHGADRGRELQACLAVLQLSPSLLPVLLRILRAHQPQIHLPHQSARVLAKLRTDGWRLGVLTNGAQKVQARKVAALRVPDHVDTVLYANDFGSGAGKPEPEPFFEIARRLGVPASRVVVVGDDPRTDIAGALAAGMHAIHAEIWSPAATNLSLHDGSTVRRTQRLGLVPALAGTLVTGGTTRHAA